MTTAVAKHIGNNKLMANHEMQLELFEQFHVSPGLIFSHAIIHNKDGNWQLIKRSDANVDCGDLSEHGRSANSSTGYSCRVLRSSGQSKYGDGDSLLLDGSASVDIGETQDWVRPF